MDMLKHTPLYDAHVALGGKLVDFGGWALPVQYSSILSEHKAVRECVGLFDVSHMGEIRVTGKGAFDFLQHVLTNDLTTMLDGRCRYSPVCYDDGGTVDDILVCRNNQEDYLLVVNASNTDKDFEWLLAHKGENMQIVNESPSWGQLALQGPRFLDVLAAADAKGVPEKYYTFIKDASIAGIPCMIARTGYTGELGVEVYCKAEDSLKMHAQLMKAGEAFGLLPCGLGARDTLRFEASMPLYGHELTKDITPVECGLEFAIKLDKADFIGKDALLKPKERERIGLKLTGKGVAREGSLVFAGDNEIGFVTSGGVAPTIGGNYAMALVKIGEAVGEITIDVRARRIPCEITPLPFYKRGK